MILEPFFLRALAAGIGVAMVAGPLGCFVVWRRMAYFGDATAHAALLGVALGLLLGVDLTLGVVAVTVAAALLLVLAQRRRSWLSTDALLGIMSHAALSFGLVAVGLMAWLRIDLMGYLFGDILAVTERDILVIGGGGAVALAVLAMIWRPLLALTVHEDLAAAENVQVLRVGLVFVLLLAVVVGLAMKVVGVVLITSMLIIPAATARRLATSPERMAVMAALIGSLAVICGLFVSLALDTPSGPSIVVAAALLFLVGLLIPVREA